MLSAYYDLLTPNLRTSYAPPDSLVQNSMNGYDPQFFFLMTDKEEEGSSLQDMVKGLLVFSQDSALVQKPLIDETNTKVEI